MQKLLPLLSLLFVLFQSCSSSDSDAPSPDSILLKRIVETTPQGDFTFNYIYNGNKMVQSALTASNFLRRGVYTYTGDLITKIEYFDSNDTLIETYIYNYNPEDKVASMLKLVYLSGTGSRVTLAYNSDGTVTAIGYSGDLINQNTLDSNNTITFSNGEISSLVENLGAQPRTITCLYDNKNNPFKNVIGYAKIGYANEGFFTNAITHNLIQSNYSQAGGAVYTTNLNFTYNSNDFPLTQTSDNSDVILTYTYY